MRPDLEQLKKDILYEQKQIDVIIAKITETKDYPGSKVTGN